MKANSCGTITEQIMHRANYQTLNEREGCHNCAHSREGAPRMKHGAVIGKPYLRCKTINTTVQRTSICNLWQAAA